MMQQWPTAPGARYADPEAGTPNQVFLGTWYEFDLYLCTPEAGTYVLVNWGEGVEDFDTYGPGDTCLTERVTSAARVGWQLAVQRGLLS